MSLDTYANLKLEVAAWLDRSNLDVTSGGIDTYIDIAESWFNRNLRVRKMITAVATPTLVITADAVTHPTDWLEWDTFYRTSPTPYRMMNVLTNEAAFRDKSGGIAGYENGLIVRGGTSYLYPTPSTTDSYAATYYAQIPALSGSNTTNWLLTAYPEAYLYGTLMQAAGFLQNDPRIPVWQSAFGQVVDEISQASARATFGGGNSFPIVKGIA